MEDQPELQSSPGQPSEQANVHMAGLVSARFRRVMKPLALCTGLCVALAAPVADFLLERHDIARRARRMADDAAARLAQAPPSAIEAAASELARSQDEVLSVTVAQSDGRVLAEARDPHGESWPVVRGDAPLLHDGARVGTISITLGEREWLFRDEVLLGVFGTLGILLGCASYLFPLRLFREDDLVRLFAWRSIKAAEDERLRLSRDLHDGVGQTLGGAAIALARVLGRAEPPDDVGEGARLVDRALDELRAIVRGLRPPSLDDLGLGAAVEGLARETARAGLDVRIDVADIPAVDGEVEQTCYRLAQEALANVVRHAGARRVHVSLAREANALVLEVRDDGRGFAPERELGLGLVGARERASRIAGRLSIESARGAGTCVRAVLPLSAQAAAA